MAFPASKGVEPIPGYRLVERLGTGGYGEVWKATAPGGLTKAVKIIYGNAQDSRAEQEVKALNRIKEVRHPFLLSLERIELLDNQVFIVTELADGSLLDRFQACQQAGFVGIPREELLPYLRDAADALDYMNEQYGLQHLDIKPQNLLLLGGRIKIADFGLVKELYGTSVTATGGVTPLYASPEAFDGRVSRFSDQYSLAIVYQEMLTGSRPFPGRTTLQLAAQHLTSPPLLDPLPAADRPVLARALAKVPEQRFPTCREMVDCLIGSARPSATTPPPAAPKPTSPKASPVLALAPPAAAEEEDLLNLDTLAGPEMSPLLGRTPPEQMRAAPSPLRLGAANPSGKVGVRPTLFLGLGGLAGCALRRLRRRLRRRFGDPAAVPVFGLLHLDTDRGGLRPCPGASAEEALDADETLWLPLHRPEHYRHEARDLLRWLDRRFLYGIPRSRLTEGIRSLGRLALVDNAADVLTRLREVLSQLTSPQAVAATAAATGLALREESPRVFLVTAIGGGTGGGMLIDAAYAVRQVLTELNLSVEGICAVLAHVTGDQSSQIDLARINAYATLTEVNHFSRLNTSYPGDPRYGLAPAGPHAIPFQECYLVHLGDRLSATQRDAAADVLAEYLYLDAASAVGDILDQYRQSTHSISTTPGLKAKVRSFGLCRLVFPRRELAEAAADRFCRHLVGRWQEGAGRGDVEQVKADCLGQAKTLGLEAEALTDALYEAATAHWGEAPDAFFRKVVAAWLPAADASPPTTPPPVLSRQTLTAIDGRLGLRHEADAANRSEPPPLEAALRRQTEELGARLGRTVVDWLITLVEDPRKRCRAAEIAAGCLQQHLTALTESARSLVAEYRASQATLGQLLEAGEPTSKGAAGGWLGRGGRRLAAPEPDQKLQEYCWLRLKEVVLENTQVALRAVSGRLVRFAQELQVCRQKLFHFADAFGEDQTATPGVRGVAPLAPGTVELIPGPSATVAEAAEAVFQRLGPQLGPSFDDNFQTQVFKPRGGLWGLVTGNADPADVLKTELRQRALAAILDALKEVDAAQLFQEAHPDRDEARQALADYLQAAAPQLGGSEGWRHLVAAVPPGPAGAALQELIPQAVPELPSTLLESEGDVLFCQEAAHLPLPQIARALLGDEPTHLEIAQQVRTRVDVSWAPLSGS